MQHLLVGIRAPGLGHRHHELDFDLEGLENLVALLLFMMMVDH